MANIVSSFFQCYPSAGSLSRSVVQEGSGGKTLLIGGFSSILLGAVIIALTPLFQPLPMSCLAAIIIVNLKGLLFQMKDFLFYFHISCLECVSKRKRKRNCLSSCQLDSLDVDLCFRGFVRCGYWFVCGNMHIIYYQYHTNAKVSRNVRRKISMDH